MSGRVFVKWRPLDVWRWSDFPELNRCLGEIATEIERLENRERNRSAKDAKRFREALKVLVLNLYAAWKADPALQVALSLRSNDFSPGTRYDALFLSYKPFKAAFEGLKALGYLVVDKEGNFDRAKGKGYRTRARATQKLITMLVGDTRIELPYLVRNLDEETVILRDKNKQLAHYDDTPATIAMRGRLERINATLSRHWPDLYVTDDELRNLNAEISKDPDKTAIDFSARQLHRVFNDDSFDKGGRFYGGWWQSIPREYRRLITINGKQTVEIDYSAIHARILYALEGLSLADDPFLMVGFPAEHRQLVKQTFYALVNAGPKGVQELPEFKEAGLGLSWDDFCQRIMDAHAPIKKYFRSGYGLRLMKLDSDIAEKVMLHFAEKDIPVLPVHDSFLMHHGYEQELREVMEKAFREVVGASIATSAKGSEVMKKGQSDLDDEAWKAADLDSLLQELNSYKGYNDRLDSWRRLRQGVGVEMPT